MPQLVVEKGNDRNAAVKIAVGDKIVVGRDVKANLRVHDVMTSRKHFAIISHKDEFYLKDLKSANGTFLNGNKVEQEKIKIGDRIQIGETVLSFLAEDEGKKKGGLVGKEIAGYLIEERLGRGAMGTVYLARQISLDRLVALKILAPDLLKDKSFVEMFIKEARACGRLNHPNIIGVYDVGNFKGVYYFSMEYVEKGSVADLITNNRRLECAQAIPMIKDACQALSYAEKQQIIHRDIKPDNLFINAEDTVKLGDLGLAHSATEEVSADGVFGTPHYIAPEQALGEKIDHRADIYALGCTFYRMITGQTPYRGANVQEILRKQVKAPAPYAGERPSDLAEDIDWPAIPRDVADIIYKMMAKNVDERYRSAAEILPDLDKAAKKIDTRSARAGAIGGVATNLMESGTRVLDSTIRRASNNVPVAIGVGVLILIIIIGAIVGLSNMGGDGDKDKTNNVANSEPSVIIRPVTNRPRNTNENASVNEPGNESNQPENVGPTNRPPDNGGGGPNESDRKRLQELFEEMILQVDKVLYEYKVAERGLEDFDKSMPGAILEMHRIAKTYEEPNHPDARLLLDDEGNPRNTYIRDQLRQLEAHYAALTPLAETHDQEYQACLEAVRDFEAKHEYGPAIQAYREFAAKYWYETSRPIKDYREWLDDHNRPREKPAGWKEGDPPFEFTVDFQPWGFPGAVDVWLRPNGRMWQLIERIGAAFATQYTNMEADLKKEEELKGDSDKYQARRDLLRPHIDYLSTVVNVWKLNSVQGTAVTDSNGRPIHAQAVADLDHLGKRMEAINAEEQAAKREAVANLRAEVVNGFEQVARNATDFNFHGAVKVMDDLVKGRVFDESMENQSDVAEEIRTLAVDRLAQLRLAAEFFDSFVEAAGRARDLELSKPTNLDNDWGSKLEVTRLQPAVGGRPTMIRLQYRGDSREYPLSVLTGDEFYAFANDVLKLESSRDVKLLQGAAIAMLERGAPGNCLQLIKNAQGAASGTKKEELRQLYAWALLVKSQALLNSGDGAGAKVLIDEFKRQYSDTAAYRFATTAPADRPLGR